MVPGRRIIGTAHGQVVYRKGRLHTGAFATPICRIGSEVADCPEISPLGGEDEPTDGHVLDHALLEWRHGVLLHGVITQHV